MWFARVDQYLLSEGIATNVGFVIVACVEEDLPVGAVDVVVVTGFVVIDAVAVVVRSYQLLGIDSDTEHSVTQERSPLCSEEEEEEHAPTVEESYAVEILGNVNMKSGHTLDCGLVVAGATVVAADAALVVMALPVALVGANEALGSLVSGPLISSILVE